MRSIIPALCILFLLGSCQNEGKKGKVINPNGDSELALLMRDMFDDGMLVKQQILKGNAPEIHADYMQIRHAAATEPEKVASPDYALYARAYEATVDSLQSAVPEHRPAAYQVMVGACMNCHQAMCPGPMVKIKKMYFSEVQLKSLASAE